MLFIDVFFSFINTGGILFKNQNRFVKIIS